MRKKKEPTIQNSMDVCTLQQQERGLYVIEKTHSAKRQRHVTTCPLDYYLHRSLIAQYQWEAGEKLFNQAIKANMTPGVKSANMTPTAHDGTNQTEATVASQMDAAKQVSECLKAIVGLKPRKAVYYVCIEAQYIAHVRKFTKDKKIEFYHFLEGIEDVARFYGLIQKKSK